MTKYLLGLDNGSTVIKAALFDLAGNEVAVARVNVDMLSARPGHYQRNLEAVKAGNFTVIQEVLTTAGISGESVLGVAITGHGNGAYLVDADGKPAYDGVSSADSRAKDIVSRWYADGTAKKILPYTLQSLWPGQPPAIIAWFKEYEPEVLRRAAKVILAKDYVRYLLTGEIFTERTDISGTSLYNVLTEEYDPRILEALDISEYRYLLPEVKKSAEICGKITQEVAEHTGLQAGTPVAGGLFDIQAATIATGIVEASAKLKLNIVVGTWSINQYLTKSPTEDENLFMTSLSTQPGNWLITEGSATSASNLEWFASTFLELERLIAKYEGKSVYDICNRAVAETTPEDTDIIFLPFLFGSNTGSEINGSLLNLRMRHKRAHIIRAIYEGIVFSHRYHIEKLFGVIPAELEVVLAGGGANSREWVQMFADILQVPVTTTKGAELGALGAAMVAGVAVGEFSGIQEAAAAMVHLKERFEPDSTLRGVYDRKYKEYLRCIECLA